MRRVLWNIYAWPITVLLVLSLLSGLRSSDVLRIIDLIISVPLLIALHLHIWDVKFLSNKFWKPYAFVFLAWELLYNLLIAPIASGESFKPINLLAPVILLPFYIALFKYAFRKWGIVREPITSES